VNIFCNLCNGRRGAWNLVMNSFRYNHPTVCKPARKIWAYGRQPKELWHTLLLAAHSSGLLYSTALNYTYRKEQLRRGHWELGTGRLCQTRPVRTSATEPLHQHTSKSFWCASA
jgi:hypothetical protein